MIDIDIRLHVVGLDNTHFLLSMADNTVQEVLKRCRHPGCYKFLKRETRRKHYARIDPDDILPSDSGSDSDMDESDGQSNEDIETIPAAPTDDPMNVDRLSQADASDNEDSALTSSEGDDNFPDVQHDGHEVFSPSDSGIGELEEFMFNEGDNDPHVQRTLEEMLQRLQDWRVPEREINLYQHRTYVAFKDIALQTHLQH
jgi:hypothetical protein